MPHPVIIRKDGGGPTRVYGTEANSQTFVAGNFVYSNSGAITECTASTDILGIAKTDATNVTSGNAEIAIEVIYPGDEILIDTYNSNTAAAYDASSFVLGTAYDLTNVSSVHKADYYVSTQGTFIFLGYEPNLDGGTSYRARFALVTTHNDAVLA